MKFPSRASLLVVATLLGAPLLAQQPKSSPPQGGRDLYRALGGDRLTLQTLEAVLSMAGRDPKVAPYEGIIRGWLRSSLATTYFEEEMSKYYSTTFSEKELKDIIAFLRTPTGQKAVAQLPGVIQHAANLSAVLMEQNRQNLEELLGKRKTDGKTRR